ncbi:MAG: zincin-like metallopeptidase domain-containing protein [Eubacterium sp.]|nr:zincin-like metallopeptidase domain-containing protein [Eubacterium sp.]
MEMMNKKKTEYRDEVADMFIKALSEEPIEFIRGWNFSMTGMPENAYTDKQYNGINKLYLKIMEVKKGYGDNRWLTFKQIKENGYHLQKGAKGEKVEYYIPYDYKKGRWVSFNEYNEYMQREDAEDDRYRLKQRLFTVFNAALVDGIDKKPARYDMNNIKEEEVIERISKSLGVAINERRNSASAFYSPQEDIVVMPEKTQFKTQGDYVRTALHELAHATGSKERLNRNQSSKFGSRNYAYEELIAEITCSFLGEYIKEPMTEDILNQHKAYIQSWTKEIRDNKNFLFKAVKEAEKAADYIIEKAQLQELKNEHKSVRDYWIVEHNEHSDLISKDYKGEIVTRKLLDEIKKLDEDVYFNNTISEHAEYMGKEVEGIGCYKFYFDHIVDGKAIDHLRIDVGDGGEVNNTYFDSIKEKLPNEEVKPEEQSKKPKLSFTKDIEVEMEF